MENKLEISWNTDGTVTAKRGVDIWPKVGVREFEMPSNMTKEQVDLWINGNTLLNKAIPQLDIDQAEFLLSGMLPGEFDKIFKENKENV
jgi:hypothetical protein